MIFCCVRALFIAGPELYGHGLYSYGLYGRRLYSYGLFSNGLYSYGP